MEKARKEAEKEKEFQVNLMNKEKMSLLKSAEKKTSSIKNI